MFSIQANRTKILFTFVSLLTCTLTVFAEDPNAPQQVIDWQQAAQDYEQAGNFTSSIVECQKIIQTYPDHQDAILNQLGIIKCYLGLGAVNQTDELVNEFIEKYASHPDYFQSLTNMGWMFHKYKRPSKAINLYQTALLNSRSDNEKVDAYAGIAKAAIWIAEAEVNVGDYNDLVTGAPISNIPDVDGIVHELMTNHKDAKKLGFHIFQIAEEYYFRAEKAARSKDIVKAEADFQKALLIWQKNIHQIDDPKYQAMAAYYSAVASGYIGNDAAALTYYQKVAQDYPAYEKTWHARYMIAECAKKLIAKGNLDETTADQIKLTAYQELIQNDPNCPVIPIVRQKLSTLSQ